MAASWVLGCREWRGDLRDGFACEDPPVVATHAAAGAVVRLRLQSSRERERREGCEEEEGMRTGLGLKSLGP